MAPWAGSLFFFGLFYLFPFMVTHPNEVRREGRWQKSETGGRGETGQRKEESGCGSQERKQEKKRKGFL